MILSTDLVSVWTTVMARRESGWMERETKGKRDGFAENVDVEYFVDSNYEEVRNGGWIELRVSISVGNYRNEYILANVLDHVSLSLFSFQLLAINIRIMF